MEPTMLANLYAAFAQVFDPYVLAVIFGSSMFGLFMGAIPGLSATMAVALLVPVTFFMPAVPAVAAMVSATAMAIFSGDIPGCLFGVFGSGRPVWHFRADPGCARAGGTGVEILFIRILLAGLAGVDLRDFHCFEQSTQRLCLPAPGHVHRFHRHGQSSGFSAFHIQ